MGGSMLLLLLLLLIPHPSYIAFQSPPPEG